MLRVVLGKIGPDLVAEVASEIAKLLGISSPLAGKIAKSGPIVLISQLDPAAADGVLEAFQNAVEDSAAVTIEPEDDRKVSRVNWPSPPRVNGRELSDFIPVEEPHIEVFQGEEEEEGIASDYDLAFCCPHCGERIHFNINAIPSTGTTPAPEPEDEIMPAQEEQKEKTARRESLGEADNNVTDEPVELDEDEIEQVPDDGDPLGLEDGDPLFSGADPLLDTGPLKSLESLDKWEDENIANTPMKQNAVVETAVAPPARPAPSEILPVPGGLRKDPPKKSSTRTTVDSSDNRQLKLERGQYSITINRTDSPEAIRLVMQTMQLDQAQAEKLCRRPVVPVARRINQESAREVGRLFKEIGISTRVSRG